MFSTKEEKAKEELKAAWKDNNLAKLLYIGLAKFMDLVCGDGPLPFQKFLKYTGDYFDQCILDISQKKQLNYVGGKMIMELKESNRDAPASVLLSADLYFQTSDKQWVMEKKHGQISVDRFKDWDTDTDAIELQKNGRLELSIEPPQAGVK